mgnify:CR=1 FL=1
MSSEERINLILKKMKEKNIKVGSGVPHKTYNKDEVRDLIKITNCFPELRKSKTVKILKPKADI